MLVVAPVFGDRSNRDRQVEVVHFHLWTFFTVAETVSETFVGMKLVGVPHPCLLDIVVAAIQDRIGSCP